MQHVWKNIQFQTFSAEARKSCPQGHANLDNPVKENVYNFFAGWLYVFEIYNIFVLFSNNKKINEAGIKYANMTTTKKVIY